MEREPQTQNWKKIFEIEPAATHTLYNKHKRLVHLGRLILLQNQDNTIWASLNHRVKHELLKDTVYYKIVYEDFTSYLFESIKGGFMALSLESGSIRIKDFEDVLKNVGQVVNFGIATESPQLKRKVEYHCPDIFEVPIHAQNILTPLYEWTGLLEDKIFSAFDKSEADAPENRSESRAESRSHVHSSETMMEKSKRLMKSTWTSMFTKAKEMNKMIMSRFVRKPVEEKRYQAPRVSQAVVEKKPVPLPQPQRMKREEKLNQPIESIHTTQPQPQPQSIQPIHPTQPIQSVVGEVKVTQIIPDIKLPPTEHPVIKVEELVSIGQPTIASKVIAIESLAKSIEDTSTSGETTVVNVKSEVEATTEEEPQEHIKKHKKRKNKKSDA